MNAPQRAAATALLAACGLAAAETQEQQFQAAWDAAEAARQRAAERGHEWRDTALKLDEAKALAADGDYETAMKAVARARFEGERAAEQAEEQARIWQDAVPK